MTSNDLSKKARSIQRANPGMKYTEALRHAKAGVREGSVLLGTSGNGKTPVFIDPASETLMFDHQDGRIILDEVHDMRASRNQSREILDSLFRQARNGTEDAWKTDGSFPLWQYPSDFGEAHGADKTPIINFTPREPLTPLREMSVEPRKVVDLEPTEEARKEWARMRNLVIGHAVGDTSSNSVVFELPKFNDSATGGSEDYLWVGTCATEEQAIRGWDILGQPGDRDTTVAILMQLPANQFILRNRKTGFTEMIEVDAAYLAAIAGRRGVEE